MTEIKKHLDFVTESESSLDPFAPENLRLDLDFAEGVGVRKIINTIPVRKPNPQEFIRVHPAAEFRLNVAVIDLKDERETFLVPPKIAAVIPGEYSLVTAYACINRQGVVFIWPVKLPNPDGRQMAWHRSAADAAEMAMTRWVRIKANMSLGAYETFVATANIPEPVWPEDLPFRQMLSIAFRGRLVDSPAHAVLKRLRGET
jgi:hypothetical protein